jgi:hypothetical protein
MRVRMLLVGTCAAFAVSSASAHGPQLQITVDAANGNKITTHQVMLEEPYSSATGLTAPASVYVMQALPVSFVGQPVSRVKPSSTQTFGPGFTYGYDQTLGGSRLFVGNLNLHLEGLHIWDGTAFVATGSGKEQVGLLQSSSNVNLDSVKTTASGGNLAIPISATYTADAHSSVRYTLLGDGLDPYAASRDGVYLATLQLSGTQASPSLTPSDSFYFILGKNVAAKDLTTVTTSFISSQSISPALVQYVTSVPEPGVALICIVGTVVLLVASRGPWRTRGRNP